MAKKKGTSDKRYAVDYRGLNAELIGIELAPDCHGGSQFNVDIGS